MNLNRRHSEVNMEAKEIIVLFSYYSKGIQLNKRILCFIYS